jgi:S-(hydroxymethyl)glutathione dehydrogenase/alcohol dehydrogenase
MRIRGAVVVEVPGEYEVVELDLDGPRQGELLVAMVASGLCHSDDHVAKGDSPVAVYPYCGGHEGAGVVAEVGPHTPGWEVGDHVVFSFLPACGRCRWCASGMQNLCDLGASALSGARYNDPASFRLHLPDGTPVGQALGLGTFADHTTVSTLSAVKVDRDLPLEHLCLLGCSVGTGWGSAVHSAAVRPGQCVVVMGIGGVGINAVQGAAHAGAGMVVAVDPIAFKREMALKLGATHAVASMDEAGALVRGATNGQGADAAIVTVGVLTGQHVAEAFSVVRKAGTVVVTALGHHDDIGVPVPLRELTLYQKRIQGSLFGSCSPSWDILQQLQMFRDGQIKLAELVTREYGLHEVAQGYRDMHAGKNIRGIVRF